MTDADEEPPYLETLIYTIDVDRLAGHPIDTEPEPPKKAKKRPTKKKAKKK